MKEGRFCDFTGENIHGWEVLRVERFGGGKPTLWLARHKCGNEQILRIDQLQSGRGSLCRNCGINKNRSAAAKVASAAAARKPKKKKGPTLLESIENTRAATNAILGKDCSAEKPKVERRKIVIRKMSAWEVGFEQAKAFSRGKGL